MSQAAKSSTLGVAIRIDGFDEKDSPSNRRNICHVKVPVNVTIRVLRKLVLKEILGLDSSEQAQDLSSEMKLFSSTLISSMTVTATNDMVTFMSILPESYSDMQHMLDSGVSDTDHISRRFGKDTWQLACMNAKGRDMGTNIINIMRAV